MSLIKTLIDKVTALTNIVNSILGGAKKIDDLPDATIPLDSADHLLIVQSGASRKVDLVDLQGEVAAGGKVQFGDFSIYGASGNTSSAIQDGDIVTGWFDATEFFVAAIYNGGDTAIRTNFTILQSFKGL